MKDDAIAGAELDKRGLQQFIAGEVVGHDVVQMQALGRGVFDVPHVEIKPAAV